MKKLLLTLVALIATIAPASAQERLSAPAAGVSIVLPKGWSQVQPSEVMARLLALDQNNPDFTRAIQSGAADPVLAIARDPKKLPAIAPSVKLSYKYFPTLRDIPLARLVSGAIAQLRIAFGAVEILDPPGETALSGMPAGHYRVRFDARGADGVSIGNISEVWAVRRGDYIVMVGATYAADETPEIVAQLRGAIDSIVISPDT